MSIHRRNTAVFVTVIALAVQHCTAEYSPAMSWDVCSPSRIIITLSGAANGGIIYVKGYGSACRQDTSQNTTTHEFVFATCGIEAAETYFTVIVQKNPLYQTGSDLQESLMCIYDLSDITVNNGLGIGDKDDDAGINKTVKPTAQMLLYKDGVDVGGSDVKLTDVITMTIQLDNEYIEDFDIKSKACTANYITLTESFCSADVDLFPHFVHVTQGVITSTFGAFRTTELSGGLVQMIFTCTVQVCRGLCTPTTCSDGRQSWGRKKRAVTNDDIVDDVNVGTSLSVGTEIDLKPTHTKDDSGICMNTAAFVALLVGILVVIVLCTGLSTVTVNKMLKRGDQLRKLTSEYEENDVRTIAQQPKPPSMDSIGRRQSVTVMTPSKQNTIVLKSQILDSTPVGNDNKNSANGNCVLSKTSTTNMSSSNPKRNTLKTQSSVTVMYNSGQTHNSNTSERTGHQSNESSASERTKKTANDEEVKRQLEQCRALMLQLGKETILKNK